jgi:hypothetical protein
VIRLISSDCPRLQQKREFIMSKAHLYLALTLAAIVPACAGRYGKPSASAPATLYADAGLSDERLVVDGLVEFGDSFLNRHRPKGTGQLTISPERIGWINTDNGDRSFSIRPDSVKSVTMECVIHAGGNVCLEMDIETITGLAYHFRDIDWAGGYNDRIRNAHDHLKQNFPRIVFAEKVVDEIK